MDFDVIGGAGLDTARAKRLLVGYAAGVLVCGAGIAVAVNVSAGQEQASTEEELVDVTLAAAPEEKAPEPPPPPPEPVAAVMPAGRKQLTAPKAIPTTAPDESDAKKEEPPKDDPYADGKGGVVGGSYTGVPGGTGTGTGKVVPPPPPPPPSPPPPPPPPKPVGPVQVTENMTPAVAISNPPPSIANAMSNAVLTSAGVEELTVVVRYVISATGAVTSASIARGSSAMDPQILATVRSWKFKPAMTEEGKAVSVSKVAKFRFKLKT